MDLVKATFDTASKIFDDIEINMLKDKAKKIEAANDSFGNITVLDEVALKYKEKSRDFVY